MPLPVFSFADRMSCRKTSLFTSGGDQVESQRRNLHRANANKHKYESPTSYDSRLISMNILFLFNKIVSKFLKYTLGIL